MLVDLMKDRPSPLFQTQVQTLFPTQSSESLYDYGEQDDLILTML